MALTYDAGRQDVLSTDPRFDRIRAIVVSAEASVGFRRGVRPRSVCLQSSLQNKCGTPPSTASLLGY